MNNNKIYSNNKYTLEEEEQKNHKLHLLKYYKNTIQKKGISLETLNKKVNVAKNFLIYCNNFEKDFLNKETIESYLWLYYNNKSNLKDFLNIIKDIHELKIDIDSISKPKMIRPKCSHQILKDRVIIILQNPHDRHFSEKYIIDSFIGYFHWIKIPSNVYNSFKNIRFLNNNYYFVTHSFKFYLPNIIKDIQAIKSKE